MKIAQIGEQVLNIPARTVTDDEFNQPALEEFVESLQETMSAASGVGIAAPQVFDPRAIIIIASRPNARYPDAPLMEPLALINPQISTQSNEKTWEWEGCLSVPGLRGWIERSDWVEVQYRSQNGEVLLQRFEGFVARIFLHEYDHLIGKTWLDHIQSTDHIMANDVWLKTFHHTSD